jgi:hypothetical protein
MAEQGRQLEALVGRFRLGGDETPSSQGEESPDELRDREDVLPVAARPKAARLARKGEKRVVTAPGP